MTTTKNHIPADRTGDDTKIPLPGQWRLHALDLFRDPEAYWNTVQANEQKTASLSLADSFIEINVFQSIWKPGEELIITINDPYNSLAEGPIIPGDFIHFAWEQNAFDSKIGTVSKVYVVYSITEIIHDHNNKAYNINAVSAPYYFSRRQPSVSAWSQVRPGDILNSFVASLPSGLFGNSKIPTLEAAEERGLTKRLVFVNDDDPETSRPEGIDAEMARELLGPSQGSWICPNEPLLDFVAKIAGKTRSVIHPDYRGFRRYLFEDHQGLNLTCLQNYETLTVNRVFNQQDSVSASANAKFSPGNIFLFDRSDLKLFYGDTEKHGERTNLAMAIQEVSHIQDWKVVQYLDVFKAQDTGELGGFKVFLDPLQKQYHVETYDAIMDARNRPQLKMTEVGVPLYKEEPLIPNRHLGYVSYEHLPTAVWNTVAPSATYAERLDWTDVYPHPFSLTSIIQCTTKGSAFIAVGVSYNLIFTSHGARSKGDVDNSENKFDPILTGRYYAVDVRHRLTRHEYHAHVNFSKQVLEKSKMLSDVWGDARIEELAREGKEFRESMSKRAAELVQTEFDTHPNTRPEPYNEAHPNVSSTPVEADVGGQEGEFVTEPGVQMSKYFNSSQFKSKGNGKVKISRRLITILDQITEHFGAKVSITSGYRDPAWNARVGGAKNSQHMQGIAADIQVAGVHPSRVYEYVVNGPLKGIGGVGSYPSWVHVDCRANGPARWKSGE